MTTLPKVGDVVHYRSRHPGGEYTPACRAAIVTEVYNFAARRRRGRVVRA